MSLRKFFAQSGFLGLSLCLQIQTLPSAGSPQQSELENCDVGFRAVLSNKDTNDLRAKANEVLLDILRSCNWTEAIVIGDDHDQGDIVVSWFLEELSAEFRQFSVFHADSVWSPSGLPALIQLGIEGATQSLSLVLVCSLACVTSVLQGATEFESKWKTQTALRERSRWLVHVTDVTDPARVNLSDVTMNNVAVLFASSPQHSQENAGIYSAFTLSWTPQGRRLQEVAAWTDAKREMEDLDFFPNAKFGLNGRRLRIGMNAWVGFNRETLTDGTVVYNGTDTMTMEALSTYLNFTYEVVMTEDESWGARGDNGTWTGLIGMLQRQEVDMTLTPLTVTFEREEVVEFSAPISTGSYKLLHRRVDSQSYGWLTYFKPLRMEVVGCIGAALLLTALFLSVVERRWDVHESLPQVAAPSALAPRGDNSCPCRCRDNSWSARIVNSLQFAVGALFLQSYEGPVERGSGRVVVASWWLFCVVVAATYSGNLVAFLAVNREEFPISSVQDLVHQTRYKWGAMGNSSVTTWFQNANISLYKELWSGIQESYKTDPDVLNNKDNVHIKKVLTEDYILIGDDITCRAWASRDCQLEMVKEGITSFTYSAAFQNNSAYVHFFSNKISALRESGLVEEWDRRWRRQMQNQPCPEPPSRTQARPASLTDVQSALYLLLAGAGVSICLLLGEIILTRIKRRKGSAKGQ